MPNVSLIHPPELFHKDKSKDIVLVVELAFMAGRQEDDSKNYLVIYKPIGSTITWAMPMVDFNSTHTKFKP